MIQNVGAQSAPLQTTAQNRPENAQVEPRQTGETQQDKVARIREMVQNGTYRVDIRATAERMVQEMTLGRK